MRDDFSRLTSSRPAAAQPKKSTAPAPAPRPSTEQAARTPSPPTGAPTAAATPPTPAPAAPPTLALAGKSEAQLRAALGAPAAEEERPPGKRWRYRDGQCTLDIQLYPNVETKQFTTLAYDVRSNVDSDEGKRVCMAQFQSRLGNAR